MGARMRFRFCPSCGAPLSVSRRAGTQVCPECDLKVGLRPAAMVAGLLVRRGPEGPEVLLVRRSVSAGGDGLYALPATEVQWGEEAREAVVRAVRRQAGVETEVIQAYDVHSNFHQPERLSVGAWFRLALQGAEPARPVAGETADQVGWFPFQRLPALAFQNDRIVLERLGQELQEGEGIESLRTAVAELTARLNRRRRRYRDLLEAYSNELMRGAWINELHVRLSEKGSPREIAEVAAEHIAHRREVDEVRVWFPGPPDRCDHCPWADRCPRVQCLHLITVASGPANDPESTGYTARSLVTLAPEEERIALLRGVPAADVALQAAPIQAELPGAGAQPVRFQGFPLDVAGSLPGVLGLVSREPIDANARRLYEVVARHVGTLVRNAQLVTDLRASDDVKRSFIARLSHELKTPLTAILSFSELLREELSAEGNKDYAEGASQIEQQGRKLLGIVETILEIAKLESGTVLLEPQRVNLADLIEERLPPFRERAAEKDLPVELLPPRDRAATVVWADPRRVRQTLDQLLSNAVKFTKRGAITVELVPAEDEVTCRIKDTGIGIPAQHHRSVFDPFHQVSDSIHLEYGGLGLGLALAKVLVELQSGRIGVESQPGVGSTFWFALPRSAPVGN